MRISSGNVLLRLVSMVECCLSRQRLLHVSVYFLVVSLILYADLSLKDKHRVERMKHLLKSDEPNIHVTIFAP